MIPIFLGVASLLGIGAYFLFSNFSTVKGKTILILGERGVGKTLLSNFLAKGEIPKEFEQTQTPQRFSGEMVKLKDLEFKLKEIIDVPGSESSIETWKKEYQSSDLIIYLFRLDLLNAPFNNGEETLKRMQKDARRLETWRERDSSNKESPRVTILVGTHLDKDVTYKKENYKDYEDSVSKKIREVKIRLKATDLIIGSMQNQETTQKLVGHMMHIANNKLEKN